MDSYEPQISTGISATSIEDHQKLGITQLSLSQRGFITYAQDYIANVFICPFVTVLNKNLCL